MKVRRVYLALAPLMVALACAAGPESAGKDVFVKRCSGCHATDADKEGPRLRGVLGRKAGSVPGFLYSDALRNSSIVWDEAHLEKWLEKPEAVVPGNNMEFRVASAGERKALIDWLKTLRR